MADSDDKKKHFLMAMCHYFDEDESRLATIPTILNQAIEVDILDEEQKDTEAVSPPSFLDRQLIGILNFVWIVLHDIFIFFY